MLVQGLCCSCLKIWHKETDISFLNFSLTLSHKTLVNSVGNIMCMRIAISFVSCGDGGAWFGCVNTKIYTKTVLDKGMTIILAGTC